MRWRFTVMITAALAASSGAVVLTASNAIAAPTRAAGAVAASSGGTWGSATAVPGLKLLNAGGIAQLSAESCASAGNCSAGGFYRDGSAHEQAFVVSQVNGTWGKAKKVPATATLNAGGVAGITSVSCASAGNCSAGGYFRDGSSHEQAFVVGQVKGTWGSAIEVPGTTALNTGGTARVVSVSCASAGNCSAGGYYQDSSARAEAFLDNERNGIWGTARQAPGTAALNAGAYALVTSLSCASAGTCTAVGDYQDAQLAMHAFVIGKVNGIWDKAKEVPGLAALNLGGAAHAASVSCASAGNCVAGGSYTGSTKQQAFVVAEVNGTWGSAKEVPGSEALNFGGHAAVNSVSCASAGNCVAAGDYGYMTASSFYRPFVASEVNGRWGKATAVVGPPAFTAGGFAHVSSLDCGSAGNCSAGGFYSVGSGHAQAWVVSEVSGTWGKAKEVPGSGTLNAGLNATVNAVSCPTAAFCGASGSYLDGSGHLQAFVVSRS